LFAFASNQSGTLEMFPCLEGEKGVGDDEHVHVSSVKDPCTLLHGRPNQNEDCFNSKNGCLIKKI